jgi:uncharacterized protein YecT (DUF1311 family)
VWQLVIDKRAPCMNRPNPPRLPHRVCSVGPFSLQDRQVAWLQERDGDGASGHTPVRFRSPCVHERMRKEKSVYHHRGRAADGDECLAEDSVERWSRGD